MQTPGSEGVAGTDPVARGSSGADEQTLLLESFGYTQELDRKMGWFSSFSASFSGLCITAGVFLTLPFVLTQSGSDGIWTWIPSSVGVILMACIFADLVGRLPIAGYAYQWTTRLTSARVGWFVAVCGLIGFVIGGAGAVYGVVPYFLSEFGLSTGTTAVTLGGIIMVLVLLAINIAGIKFAARLNNAAVVTELFSVFVIAVALLIYAVVKHPHPISFMFQEEPGAKGSYAGAFVLAFLLGAFTFTGWETAADLAEETVDAPRTAGRTILASVSVVCISGAILLFAYTYSSPDIKTTLGESVPVLSVIRYQWGGTLTDIIDVFFLISFFAASLLTQAAAGRLVYSLARDNMLPFSRRLASVSDRYRTPHIALAIVAAFAILLFIVAPHISSEVLGYILGTGSVGFNLVYAFVAAVFLIKVRRRTLPPQHGRFSLGRWAQPVAWLALIWELFVVGTLTLPKINQKVGLTTVILLVLSAIWFLFWVRPKTLSGQAGPGATPDRPNETLVGSPAITPTP